MSHVTTTADDGRRTADDVRLTTDDDGRMQRHMRGSGRRLALSVVLLGMFGPALVAEPARSSMEIAQVEETRRLRSEISVLNLLNGLYLSPSQMDQLVPLAEKAAAIHAQYRQTYVAESDAYTRELGALRDGLYTVNGATQDQKSAAVSRHGRLDSALRQKVSDEILPIEEKARAVLNEGQLAVIQDFKACMVPPKTLSDPVAVGQVTTTEREEAMLDVVRRMPAGLYSEQRARIAGAIVNYHEMMKGKLTPDVRTATQVTLAKKLDDARALSDVDYAVRKRDVARGFQMYDDKTNYRQGQRQTGPVAQWLLGPDSADVLKRWREARRKDPAQTETANTSETDTRVQRAAQLSNAALGYGGAVWRMVQERSNQLTDQERRDMGRTLQDLKNLPTPAQQVAAVDILVNRLNSISVTKGSVDALQAKVNYLCLDRRVPNVAQARRTDMPVMEDLTGLSARVARAREAAEKGQFKDAQSALAMVADNVSKFRN